MKFEECRLLFLFFLLCLRFYRFIQGSNTIMLIFLNRPYQQHRQSYPFQFLSHQFSRLNFLFYLIEFLVNFEASLWKVIVHLSEVKLFKGFSFCFSFFSSFWLDLNHQWLCFSSFLFSSFQLIAGLLIVSFVLL
jgi:hypothetical protein